MSAQPARPAIKPLTRWDQAAQDVTMALSPFIQADFITGPLHDARLITGPQSLYPLALLAVPVTLAVWHKTARPPLPPPAGPARRALTRAAAALAITLAAAATVITVTLAIRHTVGVTWWWLPAPPLFTVLTVQTAGRARLRYHAPPDARAA
jgi:hypothetical protein